MTDKQLETIESLSFREHESGVHMAQTILDALSKGNIDKELAYSLLSEVRNVIKYSYDQRIEAYMSKGIDVDALDEKKRDDLKSLDEAVYNATKEKVNEEATEEIESLLK